MTPNEEWAEIVKNIKQGLYQIGLVYGTAYVKASKDIANALKQMELMNKKQ